MSHKLSESIRAFIPTAIVIIGLSFLMYATTQQVYRQMLNDPQVQIVQDVQMAIENGSVQPKDIIGRTTPFNVEKSLATFIAFYDESGNLLESNATISGAPLVVPIGVLESAKRLGENRVTWQPNATTRIALVVRPLVVESGGYVVSGRNMKETENRIADIGKIISLGGLVILLASFVGFRGLTYRKSL